MLEISFLKENDEKRYIEMLDRAPEAFLFHSILYKELLESFLSIKSTYILVKESGRLIGALPTFIKINNRYGNIINSQPFFGSNGGFIIDPSLDFFKKIEVKQKLLEGFNELVEEHNCILSTIITSPFEKEILFYEDELDYQYRDFRIGCIKEFNKNSIDNYNIMDSLSKRCRGAVKRAIKNEITIEKSEDFKPLYDMHKEGMLLKNGIVKPFKFFELVSKIMKGHYELTYAKKNGKIIAGLLLFKFKNIIEYFTPAHYKEYVSEQGTSFLMYQAMKSAIEHGYKFWNFGGTGGFQKSLYDFKYSWGADDYLYYYYIQKHGDISKILELKPEEILKEYEWFYVIPFKELNMNSN